MEANKGLRALTHTSLDTIKEIISGVAAALLARKNDFKTIRLKLFLQAATIFQVRSASLFPFPCAPDQCRHGQHQGQLPERFFEPSVWHK